MRHYFATPAPVTVLSCGVRPSSMSRILVACSGCPKRAPAHHPRAASSAVPLPAITVRAEKEHLPARTPSTDHEPQRFHASLPPAAGGVDAVPRSWDNGLGRLASLRADRRARRL